MEMLALHNVYFQPTKLYFESGHVIHNVCTYLQYGFIVNHEQCEAFMFIETSRNVMRSAIIRGCSKMKAKSVEVLYDTL